MELIGLLLAAPVTFVASLVYVALLIVVFMFLPTAGRVLVAGSIGVVTVILVELVFLATMGAKSTYAHLGHRFTAIHFLAFFLGPPAVANLIFYLGSRLNLRRWLRFSSAALCCWGACMAALLGNIVVDEAIVGVDADKPFYMTPPVGPNIHASPYEGDRLGFRRTPLARHGCVPRWTS